MRDELTDHEWTAGYDADWIRDLAARKGALANIPPRCNRTEPICFSPYLYRACNLVERFFNKIKHCRRLQRATTSWQRTISLSFTSRRSGYGCALMSPRRHFVSRQHAWS
jgi:transposase